MRSQLRDYAIEVDERLGDQVAPTLLSVSQSMGVVPRASITDNEPRADTFTNYKRCKPNDLVLNRFNAYRGALGRAGAEGIVSPDYLVLRPSAGDAGYLHYLLLSSYAAHEMTAGMSGLGSADPDSSGFSRIDTRALMRMSLPGMNLREQRQIAEYLDRETGKIDNLIAKQEQLVATLIERRQAVIREAVTRGLDREVEYQSDKGSWVGRVPQHWAVVPLKWRARLQTGGTPKGDASFDDEASDFGWIRPDDLNETGNPSNATRFLTAEGAAELRPIRAGASLVCGIGATLGKVGRTSVAVWANQQITSIDSDLNDKFIFYVLSAAKSAIVALSVGNTLPIINNDRLGTLVLPVPPTYEQQEIADYLDKRTTSIDSTIAASRQTMSLLRERRQALISAAVTGKIDVRGL